MPIGFSKASLNAVEIAVALLKGSDSARLTLFHVSPCRLRPTGVSEDCLTRRCPFLAKWGDPWGAG
ncbi:hypothetical protein [Luteolibacter arcticus]|uniref:hypothetical protein n=1 Tax=Luteolibacter arcticus TaxID=1581411 RepID=UPI0034E0DEAA